MADMAENTFRFDLVSPEAIVMSADVKQVVIPGSLGEFGVLAHHAPLLSSLQPGVVRATDADGSEVMYFVTGGVADVNDNLCTILAEEAANLDDLDDVEELKSAVDELRQQQNDHIGMDEEHYISRQLEIALAKLDAVHAYVLDR